MHFLRTVLWKNAFKLILQTPLAENMIAVFAAGACYTSKALQQIIFEMFQNHCQNSLLKNSTIRQTFR